jgi:hypothetical protein
MDVKSGSVDPGSYRPLAPAADRPVPSSLAPVRDDCPGARARKDSLTSQLKQLESD